MAINHLEKMVLRCGQSGKHDRLLAEVCFTHVIARPNFCLKSRTSPGRPSANFRRAQTSLNLHNGCLQHLCVYGRHE